jgi:4-hydroxy-3-polyprenylbenzoate decarboxylase
MSYDSFAAFIKRLDQAGELLRIDQPVATELEITEIADRQMKTKGGGKALLFEPPSMDAPLSSRSPSIQWARISEYLWR